MRRGKDRVVLLVGKEGKQRGGDMRETDEKNEWRDERQITIRIANAKKKNPKQIITPKEAAMGNGRINLGREEAGKDLT